MARVLWYYLFSRWSNLRVFRALADARIKDRAKDKPKRHIFQVYFRTEESRTVTLVVTYTANAAIIYRCC